MNILILSCSLDRGSRSYLLARSAEAILKSREADVTFVDLRSTPLPLCDGGNCDDPNLTKLIEQVNLADALLFAVPIYNYDVNAAAKNVVELVGGALENKIVGFLCAAGGHGSYMSVMSLANSLMLDFRCLIVPRFVYATGKDFTGDEITSAKVSERINQLCEATMKLARALKQE